MHKYGIITVLPFSKYASPIIAQRKPNGILRLLVDLRKINALIADDYTNINQIITQSALCQMQHNTWQGNPYSASLTPLRLITACRWRTNVRWKCLHSILLAEPSLQRTCIRSHQIFVSFFELHVRVLGPSCQSWPMCSIRDDIGSAANKARDLTGNIRAVFQCIRNERLKLTIEKCRSGVGQVEFLGGTISSEGVSPQNHKIQKFLNKLSIPKSKKALQRYLGSINCYRNYIPRMAEKLNPFSKLLKAEVPINITSELKETFDSVNKALSDACQLALKQPVPGKRLVPKTNASFRSAGYALMIEDNPDKKIQSKRKTYAPVAFGPKFFSPAQLKISIYSKEFLAIYMAFLEFAHILWEATKPTIVLTDNKSVTRFFQTKAIPPSLWNACVYVLQFNFKIAHIAGSVNTAADSFSRLN